MAVVFPDKLVFLEHPRTASTSMRHVLQQVGGKPQKRHAFICARGNEKTVCTVRNPFDLLVSWWEIVGERQGFSTFKDFLIGCRDPFMVRGGKLFYFLETDFILRFENLEAELNSVLKIYRIPIVRLPHLQVTIHKHEYRKYYNEETRALVVARFGAEIERFGYEWND